MTNRRFLHVSVYLLLAAFSVMFAGCGVKGSGVKATESRNVAEFTSIKVNGSADVVVTVGDEQSVLLETDDNLIDLITTEVEGDSLVIGSRKMYRTRIGVNLTIQVPRLNSIDVSGSGSAKINYGVGQRLEVSVSGSGDVQATGQVQNLKVSVSGSGEVDLSKMTAETAKVKVSGSGDVVVHATNVLEANVSGSGHVQYLGNPQLDKKVSGSGSVESN